MHHSFRVYCARTSLSKCMGAILGVLLCIVASEPLAAFGEPAADGRSNAKRKNVLLIIADDLAAGALGCYGNSQCRTPNIDRLADRGMRFDNAYCQYPVCGPSRAALMSGLYCQQIGVIGNQSSKNLTANLGDRPSLAQHFKNNGWYSARVSKIYHMRVPGDITAGVDGPDDAASWTERYNCQGLEWMSPGKHEHLTNEKLNKDPDQHYGLGFGGAFYTVRTPSGEGGAEQPDKLAADKAIELLNQVGDQPFFLAVGFVRPHVPLVAPEEYFAQYPPKTLELPKKIAGDWDDIPQAGISKNSERIGLGGDVIRQQKVLQAYYASVSFMDHQVGRVLHELNQLGLRDNTIVIFKSDHGYHLGEHDFWQKMSLHEESARIPLIIALPGQTKQSSDALVEAIDLFPTLADECGLPVPEHCQGKRLRPVFQDPRAEVRDAAYCLRTNAHLLRTKKWAYIRYQNGDEELYDMENDPLQFTNLATADDHQAELDAMRTRLDNKLASIAAKP